MSKMHDDIRSEAKAALKASKAFIHSEYLSSGMTDTHTQEEWEEYLHNKDFSHVEEFNRRISNGERVTFSHSLLPQGERTMVRIPGTTFSDTPIDHKAMNKNRIKKIKNLISECDADSCSVNDLMGRLLEIEEICDELLAAGESTNE